MATVYTIPKSPTDASSSYTVQSGDTLSGIASRLGVDQGRLTGYRSGNPDLIYPGEVLNIGGNGVKATDVSFSQPPTQPSIVPSNPATVSPKEMQGLGTRYGLSIPQVPQAPAPAAPNLVDKYNSLIATAGITDLENNIRGIDAQIADETARARQYAAKQRTNPTYADIVSGKIGEDQRAAQEQIDFLTRQKNALVGTLQSKQDTIKTIMDLTGKDYANASSAYQTEFDNNIKFYNALSTQQNQAKTADNVIADNARANLNVIANNISKGSTTFDSLTPAQRLNIQKLELQAGLPAGITESIVSANPKAGVISTTTRTTNGTKYADVILRGVDGQLYTQTMQIGSGSTGAVDTLTAAERKQKYPNLPESLIGKSEPEILRQLASDSIPAWFNELLPQNQSLLPSFVQKQWNDFREKTLAAIRSGSQTTTSSASSGPVNPFR